MGKFSDKLSEKLKRRRHRTKATYVAARQPADMSIEYTIDIQLTELGFPDILETRDSSARETPRHSSTSSDDSFSPSHSTNSLSTTRKKRLLLRGKQSAQGEEAGAEKQILNDQTVCCKATSPAQADKAHTALLELSEPTAHGLTAGPETTDLPQGEGREKDVSDGDDAREGSTEVELDDSDDSEVSEVYEEEEDDEEEDEDEEGPNNESSHSGAYHCSVCDLQLPSKFKLQDHMNLHTGARPYCCAECGKRFCQIYNYRVHLRTHAQTKVDRLVCRVCMQSFKSEKALKDHVSRSHLQDEFYECDLCKRVFTSLKDCEFHVQLHKYMLDVKCEVCGRNFSSSKSLARHKRRACNRNFKCTDCTKTFTKKVALLKHSFSHLGLLPYTCVRCRCHFRLAKLYRQHKCEPERIHCVACLREFLSQEDFQQHKKDTGCWGNQEPKGDEIRCLECGERFDTTEELKKHAGAHQRVLKCAECGKGFRSALLLMSHMGGHAGKSPCLCQSCGLGFPHQQNYDSHLKTCGQTPRPASAPKKRRVSKSSSPETQKLNTKPESSTKPTNTVTKPTNTVTKPTNKVTKPANKVTKPANTVTKPTTTVTKSAATVKACHSPGPVTKGVSADSGSTDGLWKLTLDKQPPPGVKLVFFLPVCPTQSNGLPPAVSPTLSGPAMQVQPQHLRVNAALGAPLNAPLDLVKGIKQDPEREAPLDLSKKSNSSKSALSNITFPSIKSEPEELEISAEAHKHTFKNGNSKVNVKPNPGETAIYPEVKKFKKDPMDLPPLHVSLTSSKLMISIKNEPGLEFDS